VQFPQLAQTNEFREIFRMIYPFDDLYMKYDYDKHQYVLTPKAVLDKLNEDLTKFSPANSANRERDAQIMLDNISDEIYNAIYENSGNYLVQEFVSAKCPSARNILMQAMLEQVKYFMFNGSISVYSGVDFKKNVVGESARSRILAPNTQRILDRVIKELGVSLMYQGQFTSLIPLGEYEKYGY
jgi:hypothetical protein